MDQNRQRPREEFPLLAAFSIKMVNRLLKIDIQQSQDFQVEWSGTRNRSGDAG